MAKKIIKLVGDVGGVDNSYRRILDGVWLEEELAGLTSDDEIEFIIHSYGGAVFEGQYMYNILKKCPASKTAHIYGSCMSMATILSMACDKVYMCKNSLYMVHKASVGSYGNSKDIETTLSLLNAVDSIAIDTYSEKTGLSKSKLLKEFMTGFDKWLTPKESLKYGFIDAIKDPVKEVIVSDNYSNYNNEFEAVFDIAQKAEIKERTLILNKFITKSDTVMKDDKTTENVENAAPPLKVEEAVQVKAGLNTDKDAVISSLKGSAENLRAKLENQVNEISQLASEKKELELKLENLENEVKDKVDAANLEKETALSLLAKKDESLKAQEVLNRVNIAALSLKNEFPLTSEAKLVSVVDNFNKRFSISATDKEENCVDNVDNSLVDGSIKDVLKAFAIENGYVDTPKRGLGTSSNLVKDNTLPSNFKASVTENEAKEIQLKGRELNKQGFPTFSEGYNSNMISLFAGSTHQHIQNIRKLNSNK